MSLIGPYSKSIIQQQPGGAIIKNYVSVACMTMIDLTTGWFYIVEIPMMMMNTYINHLPGLASFLTTRGYVDTRVHAKFCLTTDMILNKTPLLC